MAVDYTPSFNPADVDSDYGSTGGDITVPTFTANMKPFRFWCQRALPLVYDDSLSYYEVLCKVVDQMNGFLTDLQTATGSIGEFAQQFVVNQQFLNDMADQLGQNVEDLETYINNRMDDFTAAYQQLQSYVNNYFDNLDVQQEINNKLDAMAADGTFSTLFNPVITAWMTAKTAQIDAAIANQDAIQAQQNGRISVLEGRMDTFSSLPSGSTSGNAELLDIRTNFLGETYQSAGDAVRASDMIASGFQSIGFTRLADWNGNSESSVYDTIVIDVTAYKGGHIAVIANMESFVQSISDGFGIGLYGSNVAGKTVDDNAHQYPFPDGWSGVINPVFKNYSIIPTSIQGEERVLVNLSIPSDFAFQYLKLGNAELESASGNHTTPLAIVYATSWSKTPVDPTLSIAGEAADAKAAGDALSSLNARITDAQDIQIQLYDREETYQDIKSDAAKYMGKFMHSDGSPTTSEYWNYYELDVNAGESYKVNTWTAGFGRAVVLFNSEDTTPIALYPSSNLSGEVYEIEFTIPATCVRMCVNERPDKTLASIEKLTVSNTFKTNNDFAGAVNKIIEGTPIGRQVSGSIYDVGNSSRFVNRINLHGSDNGLFNFENLKYNGLEYKPVSDDITPVQLTGVRYVGANHGFFFGYDLVIPSHGLVASDIGKSYNDGSNVWILIKIINANTIEVVCYDDTVWYKMKQETPPVSINFGRELSVSSYSQTQILPSVKNGNTIIIKNDGHEFCVLETYEIIDIGTGIDELTEHIGSNTNDSLVSRSESAIKMQNIYEFIDNGAVTVYQNMTLLKDGIGVQSYGGLQSGGFATEDNWFAVPGTTYTYRSVNAEDTYFTRSSWADNTIPPIIYFQSATRAGYNAFVMVLLGDNRNNNLYDGAGFIYRTQKMYPYLTQPMNAVAKGTCYNSIGLRFPVKLMEFDSDVDYFSYAKVYEAYYVYIGVVTAINKQFNLPEQLWNKNTEVVYSNNVTCATKTVLTTLDIKSTGRGHLLLKLS